MRMIKFTDATLIPIEPAKWQYFPIWINVDRIVCLSPALQEQSYGGRHFTLDGTKIEFEDGRSAHVREQPEAVAQLLGWEAAE